MLVYQVHSPLLFVANIRNSYIFLIQSRYNSSVHFDVGSLFPTHNGIVNINFHGICMPHSNTQWYIVYT